MQQFIYISQIKIAEIIRRQKNCPRELVNFVQIILLRKTL